MTEHETAFLDLLSNHEGALRRVARVYGGATGEQDDLYQEILLQLWRSLPSFRGDARPGTWLYRVALNTALTWRRRRDRRFDTVVLAASGVTPAATRTEATILEEFLAALGEADRSVLLLYMEGLSHDEIGNVTGASSGAVAVRLHRIRKRYTERYVER